MPLDPNALPEHIDNGQEWLNQFFPSPKPKPAKPPCSQCGGTGGELSLYPERPCQECGKTCWDD